MTPRRDEIGAHISIAGGLHLALERGRELGCGAVQIFLKNQRQWAAKPLTSDETRTFTAARRATAIRHVFAHSSYLINLGNPDASLWAQAVTAFIVLKGGISASEHELIEYCRQRLAGYKKPRHVVVVDTVRRGPNGKIELRWAREVAARRPAGPTGGE